MSAGEAEVCTLTRRLNRAYAADETVFEVLRGAFCVGIGGCARGWALRIAVGAVQQQRRALRKLQAGRNIQKAGPWL